MAEAAVAAAPVALVPPPVLDDDGFADGVDGDGPAEKVRKLSALEITAFWKRRLLLEDAEAEQDVVKKIFGSVARRRAREIFYGSDIDD